MRWLSISTSWLDFLPGAGSKSIWHEISSLFSFSCSYGHLAPTCRPSRPQDSPKKACHGRIWGLVCGAFGEASSDVHALVDKLAGGRASRDWACMGCHDLPESKSLLGQHLYRSLGLVTVRALARLHLNGQAHVWDGTQQQRRRANVMQLQSSTRGRVPHTRPNTVVAPAQMMQLLGAGRRR